MFRSHPMMKLEQFIIFRTLNNSLKISLYISSLDLISHGICTLKSNNDMLCVVILTAHILLEFTIH